MIKNNKTFKNIFGLLLTSVLLMVGCGGSSSNNPASSGNVSSGLVNVSGTVNNLSGNGRVSFYTPTAVARDGITLSSSNRMSLLSEGVYTFNTDENNSYSGQIPEGNYYIIAENSDGTMRAVSELQNISTARAVTQDFELYKTVNISGKFVSTDDGEDNAGYNLPVYIKGLPFITVTDSTGAFTFTSVPCIKATDSETKYTITSTMNYRGNVFTASTELTSSHFSTGSDINNIELTFELGEDNVNLIKGFVYNNEKEQKPVKKHIVVAALSSSGEIITTVTDSEGLFMFAVGKNEAYARISADLVNYTLADDFNKKYTLYYSDNSIGTANNSTILITETIDTEKYFSSDASCTLILYKQNGSNYEVCRSERVYMPLENYAIGDLEPGTYSYVLSSESIASIAYRISQPFEVLEGKNSIAESEQYLHFGKPFIWIGQKTGCYYAANIKPVVFSSDSSLFNTGGYAAWAINSETDEKKDLQFYNGSNSGSVDTSDYELFPANDVRRNTSELIYFIDITNVSYNYASSYDEALQGSSGDLLASGTYQIYFRTNVRFYDEENNPIDTYSVVSDPFTYVKH